LPSLRSYNSHSPSLSSASSRKTPLDMSASEVCVQLIPIIVY
jgi:hypothetical protein